MNQKRKKTIENNEISKIVTYTLGGFKQKVLMEGKRKSNPIVIFLHGGPGSPIPFSVGCRGMFPEFTDQFIMIYWDQLGCGINNHEINNDFTINHFVDMTVDLIREVKKEFPANQLMLFGVSWGSILAAETAVKVPEWIDKVITYGQVLNNMTFNEEVYKALEKAKLSSKVNGRLQEIKIQENHTKEDVLFLMGLIRKHTEGYQAKDGGNTPLLPILWGILTSPDYKLKDFAAMVKNGYAENTSLITELLSIDLTSVLSNVQVPYRILQGSKDIITSTQALSAFVTNCKNKKLSMRILDKCGHMPSGYGMEEILKESIRLQGSN